jgi:hypothetical protein
VRATKGLQRLLLAAYPPSFHARYGDELASLVEDSGKGWRDSLDLALGVGRAWVAPVFGGAPLEQRQSRLQATTITVLVVWCASLVAAGGFSKAVDDPPLRGLRGVAKTAYTSGAVVVEVTAVAVLATGFVYWLAVIVPALRARRRDVVVPALAPGLIVGGWLGVTGLVALFARHNIAPTGSVALTWPRGALILAVLVAWMAITLACVVGCAASATLALRRAQLSARRLASSTVFAGAATLGVGAQAMASVVCLVLVMRPGGGLDPRDAVFSIGAAAILVTVTVVASVSVARGFRVLRPGPGTPLRPTT